MLKAKIQNLKTIFILTNVVFVCVCFWNAWMLLSTRRLILIIFLIWVIPLYTLRMKNVVPEKENKNTHENTLKTNNKGEDFEISK